MTKITEKDYSRDPYKTGSWQEKRIAAMNRASKAGGIPFDENNPWFNEWNQILHTKAKTLLEFKKENWYVRCRKQS
jgi:hypothetical protein|tara:strand:- start:189 stop:416 length:228 start_codon:yes stop_codon:yes gene_type:complete